MYGSGFWVCRVFAFGAMASKQQVSGLAACSYLSDEGFGFLVFGFAVGDPDSTQEVTLEFHLFVAVDAHVGT